MTRCWLGILCSAALLSPLVAEAQHHQHHQRMNGGQGSGQPIVVYQPVVAYLDPGYNRYYGTGLGRHFGHQFSQPYALSAYWNQPTQVASYSNPVGYFPSVAPWGFDPARPDAGNPTPAARLKSLDLQARGDQKMKEQKWAEARAAYANSITAVPGRGEAHFRLAVCYVAIQRFDAAIREFKRALVLDPTSVRTAKTLKTLMGPDSQIVRSSIISKLGDWVREDIHNPDRLFLFGAMLHLDGDSQGREVLETALKMKNAGDTSHIARFLNPQADPINGQFAALVEGAPVLNDRPAPVFVARQIVDLRFPKSPMPIPLLAGPVPLPDAPVPMPDGPVPMP